MKLTILENQFFFQFLQISGSSYLNAFGKLRFQNELHSLRKKIDSKWHEKLNQIEETMLNLKEDAAVNSNVNIMKVFISKLHKFVESQFIQNP